MRVSFDLPVIVKSRVGRTVAEKTVVATVPHVRDLPDLEPGSAPLALRFRQAAPTLEDVEYRAYGGALWVSCENGLNSDRREDYTIHRFAVSPSPFFGGRKSIDVRIKDILVSAEKGKRGPSQTLFPNSLVAYVTERTENCVLEPLVSLRLPSALDDQVSPQIEAFDRHLDEFAFIGGKLHRREPEPLIRLSPDGRWLSATVERRGYAARPIRLFEDVPRSVGWFRMDSQCEMVDEAATILSRMGNPGPLENRIARIEIYDQGLLTATPESRGVYDVADAMRRHFQSVMSSDAPGEQPGAAMMRWMAKSSRRDIRYFKALSGKLRGETIQDDLPSDLEEAFLAMAEADPAEFANYTGSGNLRVFLEEVARRWRDRPLSLDIPMTLGTLL
nr:hypothetical protein [Neorhizobium tomejilense]